MPTEPVLESRIVFHVGQRQIYRLEVAVPDELRQPEVTLPAAGHWTIEKQDKRSVLRSLSASKASQGDVPADRPRQAAAAGAERRDGRCRGWRCWASSGRRATSPCRPIRPSTWRPASWRLPGDRVGSRRRLARSAFRARDPRGPALHRRPAAGRLQLVPRKPDIVCDTITNVRVTDRAIEETIMLNYTIRNAGIRELSSCCRPPWPTRGSARPCCGGRRSRRSIAKAADSPLRVRLELQADVMNDLRVLVENDRLLDARLAHRPPARLSRPRNRPAAADFVRRQYVVLETANRDELVVEPPVGLEVISRQQQQWQTLSELLGEQAALPGLPCPVRRGAAAIELPSAAARRPGDGRGPDRPGPDDAGG